MSIAQLPDCPTGCDEFVIPIPDFDDCSPDVHFGEIEKLYIATVDAAPLDDASDANEWASRIDNEGVGDVDTIRVLNISGDLPEPEVEIVDISNRRNVYAPKTFNMNVTIDETSNANYDLLRWLECNPNLRVWFATQDHHYGGNTGIVPATLSLSNLIERGSKTLQRYNGTLTWEAKFSPERIDNPLT